MARLAALCAFVMAFAAACGGSEGGGAEAGGALAYVPADSEVVVLVSTDLERINRLVQQATGESYEGLLRGVARDGGLSYEDDVEPLLGNDVVVGMDRALAAAGLEEEEDDSTFPVLALDTGDGEGLRQLLEKLQARVVREVGDADVYATPIFGDDIAIAVADDVLVVTSSEQIDAVLAREGGLTTEVVEERLASVPEDAPVRAFGEVGPLFELPELEPFLGLPWFDAVERFALGLGGDEGELRLDAFLDTSGADLEEDDLPLVTGEEAAEVAGETDLVSGGNRNQSQTTVFLLRAVRHAFPDSRFVRHVEELERELGLDFEEEILRQFDGPSVSVVDPDGENFAARSEVSDPEGLREAMRLLAPRLPQLVEDLEALRPAGMALLFLLAPDAPVVMQALTGVQVEEPETEEELYRVTGLSGEGPDELFFGVVGDVFVIGSSEERARAMADVDTTEAEGTAGAGVVRFAGERLRDGTANPFGLGPASCSEAGIRRCEELVASAEASLDGIRVRVRLRLEDE